MESESSDRPPLEIVQQDPDYFTAESIALAALVDAIDESIFKKWRNGNGPTD